MSLSRVPATKPDVTHALAPLGSTLYERVKDAHSDLVIIHAACQNGSDDEMVDVGELLAPIGRAALRSAFRLEPLLEAPEKVADWDPDGTR